MLVLNLEKLGIQYWDSEYYPKSFTVRICTQRLTNLIFYVDRLYQSYSFSVIPLLGSILASDRDSYQYLVESIARFPRQQDFANMIKDAGFHIGPERDGGAWIDLWQGVATIHTGVKL